MRAFKSFLQEDRGYSLVELSIVLMIIGIIIGGILKGQELLENARLKSILTQVNEYRMATTIFMDKYDALPGDFDGARDHIHPALKNGNNNGIIQGAGLASGTHDHEALSFWAHLAAANLIASPGQAPASGSARFGHGAPSSKLGGGFTVQHQPHPGMDGHWFLLGSENKTRGDGGLLTPMQAYSLDKKADSGDPTTGKIRAFTGSNVSSKPCVINGHYNTKLNEKVCILYFQF
jgi:prepilin-type N-terminal cleavage/methylation domain-containing protein